MDIDFTTKCEAWSHGSWTKGNLLDYWKDIGITIDTIARDYERLRNHTFSIAVLGSVGKTSTVRALSYLIRAHGHSCFITKVNDNWVPQLPLAVNLAANEKADFSVFECGVAKKGDAELMAEIVPANAAIYTEFCRAHVSELGDLEDIAREKLSFLSEQERHPIIISNLLNKPYIESIIGDMDVVYYGKGCKYDFRELALTEGDTRFKIDSTQYIISDIGLHIAPSFCAAHAFCNECLDHVPKLEIRISCRNPYQRMESLDYHGVKVIVDTSNSNERSIINALNTILQLNTDVPKNAVIGQIYGLGSTQQEVMDKLIDEIVSLPLDGFETLHFVGPDYYRQKEKISANCRASFYKDNEIWRESFKIEEYKGKLVLLRGPTRMGANFSNILEGYNGASDETTSEDIKEI